VQVRQGEITTAVIESGFSGLMRVRNPWPGGMVEITDASNNQIVRRQAKGSVITFTVSRGKNYAIQKTNAKAGTLKFEPVDGSTASSPKSLGNRTIGLWR
jgi:hypothetical protein